MIKRIFDIVSSLIVLILFLPFFLIISIIIPLESRGPILYTQTRIGRHAKPFRLLKFRTMQVGADKKGQLTVGNKDARITRFGQFLRRSKLDEIPQLFNVIKGEMSVVGPRPEVPKYVLMYTEEQKKVFRVRPGLTDLASLEFINENEILAKSENPERTYIREIMPTKLELNLRYIQKQSFWFDLRIIFKTFKKIVVK